jgi:branched-chain amino acid transport system permease protein
VLNFAHGSFYMLGAYLAYWIGERTGSLAWALALGVPILFALGWLVERLAISRLYGRDHLSQLLLTYGMVLLFNELQRALFGNEVHGVATPRPLAFGLPLGELQSWPAYRAFTCVACLLVAGAIRHVLLRTRFGMRVRAGAVNPEMVEALGVDVRRLLSILFSAGTALAALAGILAAPLTTVYPGMGEGVLIVSFVVVVIGGIGSVKGAFFGALLVGLADTLGKVLVPGISSAMVYAVMAAVLLWRPRGLFGQPAEAR